MKITAQVFSVFLFLTGLVFFLQGINILPGSYMTGDPQWVINGGIIMLVAAGIFIWIFRRQTGAGRFDLKYATGTLSHEERGLLTPIQESRERAVDRSPEDRSRSAPAPVPVEPIDRQAAPDAVCCHARR